MAESLVEIKPLFTLVDLKIDEAADVTLSSGQTVRVKLLEVKERRDRVASRNSTDPKAPRIAALPTACAALSSAEPERSSTLDSRYITHNQHSADEMTSR